MVGLVTGRVEDEDYCMSLGFDYQRMCLSASYSHCLRIGLSRIAVFFCLGRVWIRWNGVMNLSISAI